MCVYLNVREGSSFSEGSKQRLLQEFYEVGTLFNMFLVLFWLYTKTELHLIAMETPHSTFKQNSKKANLSEDAETSPVCAPKTESNWKS